MPMAIIPHPRNDKSNKNIPELYRLDFIFNTDFRNSRRERLIETYDYLCWLNSETKKLADKVGWVENKDKLPPCDNSQIFMSHHLYHECCDTRFLHMHCQHITCLAKEQFSYNDDDSSSRKGRYGRST